MRAVFAFILLSLLAGFAAAQGNHGGEERCLSYEIAYLNPDLFVDYPIPGYFGVPGYYLGGTIEYEINITNACKRTFKHITVVTVQRYFDGGLMPGQVWTEEEPYWNCETQTFYLSSLGGEESATLYGSYTTGPGTLPGLDRTQLLIAHWKEGTEDDWSDGRIILNDPLAGVWCPPY